MQLHSRLTKLETGGSGNGRVRGEGASGRLSAASSPPRMSDAGGEVSDIQHVIQHVAFYFLLPAPDVV